MLVMGPIVLEWPPPQPARKIIIVRVIRMKPATADRKYCIDPPHPTAGGPEIPPEWLKTNSVAAFGEWFLEPVNHGGMPGFEFWRGCRALIPPCSILAAYGNLGRRTGIQVRCPWYFGNLP